MGSTRRNLVTLIVLAISLCAVGTAHAENRVSYPALPQPTCTAIHGGKFCRAVEHRKAIRAVRQKERRQAARANVKLHISRRPLSWDVNRLWRQNHWERHRLAYLRSLPSSYCLGETGNRLIGCRIVQARGWSAGEWAMLDWQWGFESGWQVHDRNSSGCDGIPQACPRSKLWSQDDARLQILWGLHYIDGTYGSMQAAYDHERAYDWY